MKSKSPRPKHIPQRTCIGCRQVHSKRELVRVVHTSEGHIEVDLTGKRAGRGAYVHRTRECWRLALQDKRLETALKAGLSDADRARLVEFAEAIQDMRPE